MSTCMRRKPIVTYQSPSANDPAILPRTYGRTDLLLCFSSESTDTQQSTTPKSTEHASKNGAHSSTYSLPLFHPLGRLATALPPFDPSPHGLPLLPERWTRFSAASSRQRAVSNQEEGEGNPSNTLATTTPTEPVNHHEMKARVNHRRTRKRKRADGEHDTAYPARKTRVLREENNRDSNGDTPVDKYLTLDESEAVADPSSTEVRQRLSPAQTSVKESAGSS